MKNFAKILKMRYNKYMKKLLSIIFIIGLFFQGASVLAVIMDSDLITIKTELDKIYYDANASKKISNAKLRRINDIKAELDDHKKERNSNLVPIYYKLGTIYNVLGRENEAIDCFRTIVKYYPSSPLKRRAIVYLKYYGEAVEIDGMTRMLPYKERDEKKD